MVSFSRCLLAVTAVLLAISSVNAQLPAGTLGGMCLSGTTCNTGLTCLAGICTIATGLPTTGTLGGACVGGTTCNTGLSCLLGICTIGLPTGTEGGACIGGSAGTCNTGLSCIIGICAKTSSTNPSGTLGGTCIGGTTCNAGLQCLFGFCTIGTGLLPGSEGGSCIAGTTCNAGLSCLLNICVQMSTGTIPGSIGGTCLTGNTCNTGLQCLAGICTFSLLPTVGTCKTNADCGLQKCVSGTCTNYVVPALDCGNACPSGTNCRLGVCLPAMSQSCPMTCNYNNGESCLYGSCVQTSKPSCSPSCGTGQCVATLNGPMCVATGTACQKTSDCSSSQICNFGFCNAAPQNFLNLINNSTAFSASVRDNVIAELANIGAALASFTGIQAAAQVNAQITAGNLNANANVLIQLDATTTALQNLAFAGQNAAARVEAGATQTLQSLAATAAQAQLLVGVGAKAAATQLSVAAGASLAVSMGAAAATASAVNSITQIAALNLQGALNIVGDINSIFTFPQNGSAVQVSNGASVKVSGGVCLTGNAGSAPISITSSGNVGATAQVSAAQYFQTAANVLGSAATFAIAGVAAFSGNVVEPALTLGATATVSFAAREGSSSATIAGDLTFDNTTMTANSKLVINGTAAAGANLYFKVIRNCPATATITYNVQGSATVAVSNGFVLFNYAASTYANVGNFYCNIQICGTDGCILVNNPNLKLGGRRLLATGNQASFSPTSASVSAGSTVAVQAASQIKVASTIFALLVAFVVALVYKL